MGNEVRLTETLPEDKLVIFGVRPCDARGLLALDALFLENDPADAYYARRRENTTLIGLACEYPGPTCFCTRMGGALDDPQGMDVMLSPQDEEYAVQALTPKGQALLKSWGIEAPVEPAPERRLKPRYPHWMPGRPNSRMPSGSNFPSAACPAGLARMSARPAAALMCAMRLCSSDDGSQVYERIRCWDACTGEPYRRVAGGHNPRPEKGMRLRNRFYCKFYYYPQQYGPVACTGCGRCVESCPVNVDITEVLDYMAAGKR